MENTRISLIQRLARFFKSFSENSEDTVIDENKLTDSEKRLLKEVISADSVEKIETNMREGLKVKKSAKSAKPAKSEAKISDVKDNKKIKRVEREIGEE